MMERLYTYIIWPRNALVPPRRNWETGHLDYLAEPAATVTWLVVRNGWMDGRTFLSVGLLLLSWWLQTFLGFGTEWIQSHTVAYVLCVREHSVSGSVHIIQSIMWHLCNGLIQVASDSTALQWWPAVRPQPANRLTYQVRICFLSAEAWSIFSEPLSACLIIV